MAEFNLGRIKGENGKDGKNTATLAVGFKDDCDYNITALGTSNNAQATVNAAIAALPTTGGKIILREGTYNITGNITMNKANVTLEGMGNSTVIKRMSTFSNGLIYITANYCKVQDCYIDGYKGSYSAGTNRGIHITGQNNSVTGNSIVDNDRGIYVENSGIGNGFNIISGNIGSGNNRGINLISGSNNISDNTFREGGYGIYVEKGSLNLISGNNCRNNSNHGIYLASGNNNITGNICNGNGKVGIYIESSNNTITGNNCYNNVNYGIFLKGDTNVVSCNTCYSNGYGIYLSEGSINNITGNICNRNNNGIYFYYNAGSNNSVIGNACSSNSIFGISICGNYNNISSNMCYQEPEGSFGMIIWSNSKSNTLVGNIVNNSGIDDGGSDTIHAHNG